MRRLVLIALTFACATALAEKRASKPQVTVDGLHTLRFTEESPGHCTLEVTSDSGTVWSLEGCVGSPDDLYFLSKDTTHFWVVFTVPAKASLRPMKKGEKIPPYAKTVVAKLFDKDGKELKAVRLEDLLRSRFDYEDVRELAKHFKWLEGVAGVPGKGPRLTDKDEVELDTVNHQTHHLKF